MDLVAGTPVFLEEIVSKEPAFVGHTVRITGTLHSYSPTTDGPLSALIVRTQLLGVVQYHVGQTYQFIGVVGSRTAINDGKDEKDEGLMVDDAQCARTVELHARVGRVVDGLDMAVYRRAVAALRAADVVDAIA
ncbi:telomere-capping, CST complex subunit-domain-containing protein [Kickxella alabastrina]|uniref:telomere-capping, CST complex subunit-domain-containing protein n=1 Tax=Kickxella alabastrina TaxID=61397 RepID=UPI002220E2B7|nr:telomere-capping, CST complex subunit-domain-containing protein [Kickxella alabastrina]KAI7833685.1 telomere-capping, CST complex subunit-domain-containing protein [Kickxella alabastrina]